MDKKLIQLLQKRDRKTQRRVYDELLPMLTAVSSRYLDTKEDIEDVLTESFYSIFTQIEQLNAPEAFYGWAKKITINHCLQFLRKKVRFDELPEEINNESVSIKDNWNQKDLELLIDRLPPSSRSVFNLSVIEGYTHKEISRLLDISEGTSKSQLSFAKNKLKNVLNDFYLSG